MGVSISRLESDVNDINFPDKALLTNDKIFRQGIWLRNVSTLHRTDVTAGRFFVQPLVFPK
jgi:hypothetical protein